MKQFYRITCAIFMGLLLSVGTMAHAQQFPTVKKNNDGSYNQTDVLEAFTSWVETAQDLPTTTETVDKLVDDFYAKLSPFPGEEFSKIKRGDEYSEPLTSYEGIELYNKCVAILKEKIDQNAAQAPKPNEKGKAQKSEKKLTYKQLAIRIGLGIGIACILAALVLLILKVQKKKQRPVNNNALPYSNNAITNTSTNSNGSGSGDVIIRRKTSSIMHKQNIDDVVKDGNYMVINCNEFSNDSAVRTMYIKNSCIMDIYNMYAEDLRNPNNPKEDGCMVLGRWIHDEKLDEYAVTLEEVVFPGDDAVFAEYELDFGGKIKVKINEKLRKLRRDTDLQYDLTCWVHSHPGLGVFFSNTDCNLHLLHKHPTHPKLLTAIVIDILTPQQDLGIFTFKHDMSINSKADLKRLYSLDEWYKWAVESKRTAAIDEEHYDTLENAKTHDNSCYNVRLSNSSIIDIESIVSNPNRNSLYFVHGFSIKQLTQITNVAAKIESAETSTDNELVGCFMVVTHRSYPTIKNAMANYLDKVKFALVYSSADGILTTIPVLSNDLCADESYYGKQPLEDFKIWVRRKR